jgi:hypothetical protein
MRFWGDGEVEIGGGSFSAHSRESGNPEEQRLRLAIFYPR